MKKTKFMVGIACASRSCDALYSIRAQKALETEPVVLVKYNNRERLSSVYNKFIDDAIKDNCDWLVLCHDDIYVDVTDMYERIISTGYDMVGVAGTSTVTFNRPLLWHLMGGGFEGGNLRGAVAHGTRSQKMMTGFGKYPARCVMIDGVFMAISRKVFSNIRFDEENPAAFHFYDLDYSLRVHEAKYLVGVCDVAITHKSPGLREFTSEWKAGEEWFYNKNSDAN